MLKKLLAIVAMLFAMSAFAAVDVNKASLAELDAVKGIGPALSTKIVDERKKGNFKDWNDLITRVSGVGEKSAANLSAAGLTVGTTSFAGAPAAAPAAMKKDDKAAPATAAPAAPAAKMEEKKADAKTAAPVAAAAPMAKEEKPDAKAQAKADKAAAKKAKADEKAKAADEAKAKKDAAKTSKSDKPVAKDAAKDDKKDTKADAAKPAASATKK